MSRVVKRTKYLIFFIVFCLFSLVKLSFFTSSIDSATASYVVISEVQIGQSGTGNAGNDFIELYNPTDSPIDLNGYRLVKRTKSGVSDSSIKSWTSETIIPPNGYYLWANSNWSPPVIPDAVTAATIAADNGIALRRGPENTGEIIDSVAWGEAANIFIEGSVFSVNLPFDSSIERKACSSSTSLSMRSEDSSNGNAEDTDNNSNDFVLRDTPDPQNTISTREATNCNLVLPTPTITPLPTIEPDPEPTGTPEPTPSPTPSPTQIPTSSPVPTIAPTASPTIQPTTEPTLAPNPTSTTKPPIIPRISFICRVEFKSYNLFSRVVSLPQLRCSIFR